MPRGLPTLIGAPYDAGSSFLRGSAEAPSAIRLEMRSGMSNSWAESLREIVPGRSFGDLGDIAFGDDPRADIERAVAELMGTGARPLVLGGDHAITYPVLRAVRPSHPRLTILHLDAHNDLYDSFDGERFSHACPFARIMEEGLADQLVQVGIRAMTGHQRAQADRYGVEVIDMRRWMAGDRYQLRHPVYLSLDIDVLDPAFAPGVSHREPGGLSVREVLGIVQAIDQPIVGADLVEYNPRRDVNGLTAPVCAKLVKEIVAAMG